MKILIELKKIHKSFGAQVLFEEASVLLAEKQKIGLIGRNGAGKSTLCKFILGQLEPDSGEIIKSSDLKLSFLEQHDPFQPEETVLGFLERYTGQEAWRCGKMAGRFQIKNEMLDSTPISELSGGYQTRVKLTAMLLREPNFLILDEPTNFLDLNTLLLLEEFFQDFNGGFLVVSHDREFLKKTCEQTLEAEQGKLNLYPGGIEDYLAYKEELVAQAERFNRNVELKRQHLQNFVDRFGAKASKASQAQSKLKQLNRLEKIEIAHPMSQVRIKIPPIEVKSGAALRCKDLAVGYPEKIVLQHIDLVLKRGAHIAILGENGQGKTTLMRTLAGQLKPLHGDFKWSEGMSVSYYAQHVYAQLKSKGDIYSYLEAQAAKDIGKQEILNMAGSFLFRGDDVKKNISILSGGERARLLLVGLLLSKRPVLLLDEPTNHLDFETVEALGAALKKYPGTILFISHDRTFVNLVATEILEVRNGKAGLYPDTYENYVAYLKRRMHEEQNEDRSARTKDDKGAPNKQSYQERKALQSEINQLRSKIKKMDQEMSRFDSEKKTILAEFMEHPESYSRERNQRLEELNEKLQVMEESWLQTQSNLEALEKQLKHLGKP